MRVKGSGYVGIGTSSPAEKLTINNGWLRFDSNDTGIVASMANNDYWKIYGTGTDDNGQLVIKTGDNDNEPISFFQGTNYRGGIASDGIIPSRRNKVTSLRLFANPRHGKDKTATWQARCGCRH